MVDGRYKILIADDDAHIAELISLYMEKEGYETIEAHTGRETVEMFKKNEPDAVILDIMMPDGDGYQACREIRQISQVPIIMLSAKGEVFDKVLGLELGADDYMVKPFDSKELIARVKSVLRRSVQKRSEEDKIIHLPNLVINQSTYTVIYHNEELILPPKEFEVLTVLAKHPNQVFKREELLDRIWGYEFVGDTRTVDVHIKRLRAKMDKEDSWSIKTVWGIGYKFEMKG